jgi:hypothetical protein
MLGGGNFIIGPNSASPAPPLEAVSSGKARMVLA